MAKYHAQQLQCLNCEKRGVVNTLKGFRAWVLAHSYDTKTWQYLSLCAWCLPKGLQGSHGICPKCADRLLAKNAWS